MFTEGVAFVVVLYATSLFSILLCSYYVTSGWTVLDQRYSDLLANYASAWTHPFSKGSPTPSMKSRSLLLGKCVEFKYTQILLVQHAVVLRSSMFHNY